LDYLEAELESDAFVNALAEDRHHLGDVEAYLNNHRGTADGSLVDTIFDEAGIS
jgi:hypothetical protein